MTNYPPTSVASNGDKCVKMIAINGGTIGTTIYQPTSGFLPSQRNLCKRKSRFVRQGNEFPLLGVIVYTLKVVPRFNFEKVTLTFVTLFAFLG